MDLQSLGRNQCFRSVQLCHFDFGKGLETLQLRADSANSRSVIAMATLVLIGLKSLSAEKILAFSASLVLRAAMTSGSLVP